MERISLIGLGWLGLPLAKRLREKGHQVKGSATTPEKVEKLKNEGLDAFCLKLSPHPEGVGFKSLFDTDVLIVNIPPRTRTFPAGFHPEQVKYIKVMAEQQGIKKIIYTSATSVYPDQKQIARENDELDLQNTGNPTLLQAEQLLWKDKTYDLCIIRFGGLMGGERIPGKYFAGKSGVVGDTPVNFIHQEDAVGVVEWIIQEGLWNQVYNAVSPEHPLRKEIYIKNAADFGFELPLSYAPEGSSQFKIISSDRLIKTGYRFKFFNPLDFIYLFSLILFIL
jgi:nucleoside-diphosphate-sugar epimerase